MVPLRLVGGLACAFAGFVGLACVQESSSAPTPPAGDAATFEAPPQRVVVDDISPTLGMNLRMDAAVATPSVDGSRPDALPDAGAVDARAVTPDAPMAGCSLLKQDCPRGRGCYPGAGGGVCSPEGFSSELGPCLDHTSCRPGLVCVDGQDGPRCLRLCDPAMPACGGRIMCKAMPGAGAGYCTP